MMQRRVGTGIDLIQTQNTPASSTIVVSRIETGVCHIQKLDGCKIVECGFDFSPLCTFKCHIQKLDGSMWF